MAALLTLQDQQLCEREQQEVGEWEYRGTLQNPRTQKIIVIPQSRGLCHWWKLEEQNENKWGKGKSFLRLHIAGECTNLS